MVEDLVENIEASLRLNATGNLSDRLTINYVNMWVRNFRKEEQTNVLDELEVHNARANYYGGTNPND